MSEEAKTSKTPIVQPQDFLKWVGNTAAGAEKMALEAQATPAEAKAVREVVVRDLLDKSGIDAKHLATEAPQRK